MVSDMDTMVDDATAQVAQVIRVERETRGWSQADLAGRSGVSKAMISKIERQDASPTAVILARIAAAFELTLAMLLTRAEGTRHVAARSQPVWRDPESGYVRRQLFASSSCPIELVSVELPARARVDFPASTYRFIRQVVWLMKGHLVIEDGGDRCELGPGDAYAFGEPADASFENERAAACRYLVAVSRR